MKDRIEYIVCIVSDFARRFNISPARAFACLDQCGGVALLDANYGILHTLPFDSTVDDLVAYCEQAGVRVCA